MDDHDFLVRESLLRIKFLENWIVPFLDLSEENVGNGLSGENQRLLRFIEVIREGHSSHDQWDVHDIAAHLVSLLELLVVHWTIRAAEVEDLGGHLLDTATGADRLVIDLHALRPVVFP